MRRCVRAGVDGCFCDCGLALGVQVLAGFIAGVVGSGYGDAKAVLFGKDDTCLCRSIGSNTGSFR